eukprot:353125-Chlamydomonas_euryale.AAC.5
MGRVDGWALLPTTSRSPTMRKFMRCACETGWVGGRMDGQPSPPPAGWTIGQPQFPPCFSPLPPFSPLLEPGHPASPMSLSS